MVQGFGPADGGGAVIASDFGSSISGLAVFGKGGNPGAGLGPRRNGGAVVRDWLDTTVKSAKEGLALWFRRQRIVALGAAANRYYGLNALALATVRERKDLPAATPRLLLRSACAGSPLPDSLLHQALRRCHAERQVARPRAALIKLILLSTLAPSLAEDYMVELEIATIPTRPTAAASCWPCWNRRSAPPSPALRPPSWTGFTLPPPLPRRPYFPA